MLKLRGQNLHLYKSNTKLIAFYVPVAFLLYADTVLAYLFPIVSERLAGSNASVGVLMAVSAVTALILDVILPRFLAGRSWSRGFIVGIASSFLVPVLMYIGVQLESFPILILASVALGLYFELFIFGVGEFIARKEKKQHFTRDWNILSAVWGIGSITGPIVASLLLTLPLLYASVSILIMQFVAMVTAIVLLYVFVPERKSFRKVEAGPDAEQESKKASIWQEVKIWRLLNERIWPAVGVTLVFALIDASFWTLAGLFGEEVFGSIGLGWLVIFAYGLPDVLTALIYGKLNITTRKKHYSHLSLLFGAFLLVCVPFLQNLSFLVLFLITAASILLNGANILNLAVYSDLQTRAGQIGTRIGGISRASFSMGYIVGPIIGGLLADSIGYWLTFGAFGVMGMIAAIVLMLTTPVKLKLPKAALAELG
jgi:MFS family permease